MKKAVAIVSGGMDSATLAYRLHSEGYELHMVTFDYGQRHKREIDSAALIAAHLAARHTIIDLHHLKHLLSGSALTDSSVPVPHGHYAAENMKQTVVPNRNAIMISIAWGIAVAERAQIVSCAVHAGDHFIYPDCRPEFIHAISDALRAGNKGFGHPDLHIYAPYLNWTKGGIAVEGRGLNVPYKDTWTCYEGGELHCGECGACVERKEAFHFAQMLDPTVYKDYKAAGDVQNR